ncbi:hypothetical protein BD311DRAFT_796050 [Dichomitus squalens]|uniref:Uncharacterized protein n=1 Tax=Dichomitus squalens TaxID=114155 RepID=A0A4Q9MT54_9APHY|nr:hypothetical protein BD311DRAFT_796050 [Dichomitus squalens]
MTRSTSTCATDACSKKSGVNCSFRYCRACCAARPLDAPACGERYHKRIPTSTQRASSGSISQPPRFHSPALSTSASLSTSSTSSPTDSTPEVSSPLPSTSSLVAPPQPSAKLHAKPLHSIWAPAAAEVGIADRLKHKSRREELAVAQTRLVDGSSELGGDRVTTKTVTFLIWNQPECYPEEVLVHLEDYPLYTPHNLLDIISELSSNGQKISDVAKFFSHPLGRKIGIKLDVAQQW